VAERAFEAAGVLIAVSEEVAAYLETYPGARAKVVVIPNGVDPERIKPAPRPSPGEPASFRVGFVGSLKPWHGLSVLIEAFHQLQQEEPTSRLLIVGDGPERAKLSGDIERRGLQSAIELTGSVPPDQIPARLASMDVAVAPYLPLTPFYFSPLKMFEYMAAGLPVVASRIGQITRVIQNDINGVLFSPGDALDLAAALKSLRNDPEKRIRLGREARKSVLQKHTWQQVVLRILETERLASQAELLPEGLTVS
jgi:glycosyltransferase involved in cell wall biosynthesis